MCFEQSCFLLCSICPTCYIMGWARLRIRGLLFQMAVTDTHRIKISELFVACYKACSGETEVVWHVFFPCQICELLASRFLF